MNLMGDWRSLGMTSEKVKNPDHKKEQNHEHRNRKQLSHQLRNYDHRIVKRKAFSLSNSKHSSAFSLKSSRNTLKSAFQYNFYWRRQTKNNFHQSKGMVLAAFLTFFWICICITSTVNAKESLSGYLQSCSNEGEEVRPVIKNAKCFKCACLNGFVKCEKQNCPPIDECYLLESKSSDSCCKKCRGCMHKGRLYESGSEWSDPADPCKIFKCVSTVVTETTMKCFTQCDDNQLLSPGPGECCPKCPGCKINGKIVAEGQEVVPSTDDRCLICQCFGNKLKCGKKACPILNCPLKFQRKHSNECCPRCIQQKELMPFVGKCIYNEKLLIDRTHFTPDRCTNCTCLNGTSICQRATCPILECSPDYQDNDGCCPKCKTSELRSECIHNGTTYENDQTWELGPCRTCRCISGNIRCSEMRCGPLNCLPNEEKKQLPNECCPKCIETAGTCTVFGDPHFKTFDGKFFSFQGSCKYLLTADCRDHTFSIRLTNDGRGTKRSSWAKTVTIKLKNVRINLGQKMRVKVNGSRIEMPFSKGPILNITRTAEAIYLKTDLGVNVEWDGNNFVQVSVPSSYKHKLCGLCGNYNGIGRDDLTSRDSNNHSDKDAWRFANSWKVGGANACSRQKEKIATQPTCKQRKPIAYCRPLNESSVFGNCDNKLNPKNYIESCKMDVCECPNDVCHCDSFAAYAHECHRLGVNLPDWRSATNCPIGIWRHNITALKMLQNSNPRYGSLGGRKKPRKPFSSPKSSYLNVHISKNFTVTKNPDSPPPPLH